MPRKNSGRKSMVVSVDEETWRRTWEVVRPRYRSIGDFVSRAVKEKLEREAATTTAPVTPPPPAKKEEGVN